MARLAALGACMLALAACGGQQPGAALGEAAALVPADARVLLVVSTDAEVEQTRAALELLTRLPAVAEHELDLEREVLPALGPETALVVLAGGEKVWLTRPGDSGRLQELLGRLDERPVTRELDGWTAVVRDERALDALEAGRADGTLAGEDSFREAFDALPGDAVAKVWTSERDEGPPNAAAAVRAEEDGFRLDGFRRAQEDVRPYRAELLDRVPAGAAIVASFHGREGLADRLRLLPFLSMLELGDLGGALEGEGVLFVRSAALVPELTLLTEVEDEEAARRAAGRLLSRIGAQADGDDRVQVGPLTVHYGARDGVLALTTSPQGLGVLEPAADPFAEDPRFERAAERAGMPAETTGFLYAHGQDVAPMLALLGVLGGQPPPPELRANVEAVGALLLHGGRDGERHTLAGFVEIPR